MDANPTPKVKAEAGGYKDKFWIPRFWSGILLSAWLRVMAHNRFRIHPLRIGMAVIITMLGAFNSVLAVWQRLLYGRKVRDTKLTEAPVFIIGHWRSGTTLLHEFLVLDQRYSYPDTYACFAPNHFLISRWVITHLFGFLMPKQRPMDNMAVGWDRPQEDEFGLCNMGIPSPYLTQVFPNEPPQYPEYLSLDGVPPAELDRWKQAFHGFLKSLTVRNPKRIVLKSPPHTARLKVLLEMFPQAKFIHIYRDPFVVFASTINLWKRLYRDQALQMPHYQGLENYVFETFNRMYAAFERDRHLPGPGQLAEVSYEALVANPVAEVRRLYEELQLDGFLQLQPALEAYLAEQKDYKKNRYQMAPELREEVARRWKAYVERYGYADAGTRN